MFFIAEFTAVGIKGDSIVFGINGVNNQVLFNRGLCRKDLIFGQLIKFFSGHGVLISQSLLTIFGNPAKEILPGHGRRFGEFVSGACFYIGAFETVGSVAVLAVELDVVGNDSYFFIFSTGKLTAIGVK